MWPSTNGLGVMDKASYQRTAKLMLKFGGIKKAPTAGAYRTDLVQAALAELKKQGVDVNGKSYKPMTVKLSLGGK